MAMKFLGKFLVGVCCVFLVAGLAFGQTTYTSTGTGLWSTMTWSPPGTPGVLDNVIIADGNTVTIDGAVSITNLTVGQGTSGILTFDGVAARAVTISGNVTVAAGGIFIVQSSGAFTNTMSIGGDLTNNGTFDMSRASSSTICNVTFNKNGDQGISGTGTLTRFRGVTLNKASGKVLCSIDVAIAGSGLFVLTAGTWEQSSGSFKVLTSNQTIGPGTFILSGSGSYNAYNIASSISVTGTLTVNTTGSLQTGSGNNNVTVTGTANFSAGTILIWGKLTLNGGTTNITGANISIDPQPGATKLPAT
jgi:hypothetical protein